MIGTKCECHGLYQHRIFAHVYLVVDYPSPILAQMDPPSLAKPKHLVPYPNCFLCCESCQLGKHSCSLFPRSVLNKALSRFALVHLITDYPQSSWLF